MKFIRIWIQISCLSTLSIPDRFPWIPQLTLIDSCNSSFACTITVSVCSVCLGQLHAYLEIVGLLLLISVVHTYVVGHESQDKLGDRIAPLCAPSALSFSVTVHSTTSTKPSFLSSFLLSTWNWTHAGRIVVVKGGFEWRRSTRAALSGCLKKVIALLGKAEYGNNVESKSHTDRLKNMIP